jgi:hypothetical protein
LGIIIGANLVNRCASAQSNFPMCVTVYKYLIWKDFKEGAIPIGSSNTNELTQSGFEVKSGALKFPAVSSPPACSKDLNGLMYYDSGNGKFKCCIKTQDNPLKYEWSDCGGGGGAPKSDVIPFKIYEDPTLKKVVLEINEE